MAFHVGQKVVCIKRGSWSPVVYNERAPKYGDVLTIRTIENNSDDEVVLRFEEIRNAPLPYAEGLSECRFCASRFRPLISRSTDTGFSILKKLLNTNPARQSDLVD